MGRSTMKRNERGSPEKMGENEQESECPAVKRQKLNDEDLRETAASSSSSDDQSKLDEPSSSNKTLTWDEPQTFTTGLLHLSDDVLLQIFAYLHPIDLVSLSETCERLANVSSDKTLWEFVDTRPNKLSTDQLKSIGRFLQPSTKFVASSGGARDFLESNEFAPLPTLPKTFMNLLVMNAPNIKTLVLENHVIDASEICLVDAPMTLEHLAIRNCTMINMPKDTSYFYQVKESLPKLKVLDITDSPWFSPHSLLALSKSATLEELILVGCDVSECMPYASIAAMFGFLALKVLDFRRTAISDTEVTCFNKMTSLRHLYLSAAPTAPPSATLVTDESIRTYGTVFVARGRVVEENNCYLQTLVVTNYSGITDKTLRHAATSMTDLKYLDVTDTSVTKAGLYAFIKARPNVRLVPSPPPLKPPPP